jgi:hypothetical protein
MASYLILKGVLTNQQIRRERVFRDRTNPLDYLSDAEVRERYRLPRNFIVQLIDVLADDLQRTTQRSHPLPVYTQVINFIVLRVRAYMYIDIHLRYQKQYTDVSHSLLSPVKPIIHNQQLSQSS